MNPTYLLYGSAILSVVLLTAIIWLTYKLYQLDQVRKQFFSSPLKKDLEQVLVDQNRLLTKTVKDLSGLAEELTDLSILNKNNFQKIGVVRFNPFDDAGGNMSFALAILNHHNDGVVVSSLHGREGTRIYAKSIKAGASEHKLTEEEAEAIKSAT
ncbi:MAG: DUF4446 family protein [Candidatus Doudnabacteria bacterium]|nr:DUF4446 family protein [Candidatus Doudnabacteria bacterium]